jgi:gliding motility-associated protein GldC
MSIKSEIKLTVELDDNKIPSGIEWEATEADFVGKKQCRSLMLSIWDPQENATLGIDLWTKEMTIQDMNIHFHQVLIKLSDTYLRATKNKEAAKMIEDFSAQFAEKLELEKEVSQPAGQADKNKSIPKP